MTTSGDGAVERQGQGVRFWDWMTFVGLALLVYHVLVLWYRWLRPDPEFLGFTAAVAELLAIASFLGLQTERGREFAFGFDDTPVYQRLFSTSRRRCLTAWTGALLTGLFLYAGSPLAATLYNQDGARALESGRYSVALKRFQRSTSLAPANSRAHYNLATVYSHLNDADEAIAEYQVALELDTDFWPTYNNLGRLYLLAEEDPDAALSMLLSGYRKADSVLGKAVLGKNIGWSYLEKGLPRSALDELEVSLEELQTLRTEGESVEGYLAEVYRLQALTHEALGQGEEADAAWQDSLGFALAVAESQRCVSAETRPDPDCLDTLRWVAEAQERLMEESGGSQ